MSTQLSMWVHTQEQFVDMVRVLGAKGWFSLDIETQSVDTPRMAVEKRNLEQALLDLKPLKERVKGVREASAKAERERLKAEEKELSAKLRAVTKALKDDKRPLHFWENQIGLIQIYDGTTVYFIRPDAFDAKAFTDVLDKVGTVFIHNAMFECTHFLRHFQVRFPPEKVYDTAIGESILWPGRWPSSKNEADAKGRRLKLLGLKRLCKEYLGVELDKTYQVGTVWSDALSEAEMKYAADDVLYLHKLAELQRERHKELELVDVMSLEMRFLPALVETVHNGVAIDHKRLIEVTSQVEVLVEEEKAKFFTLIQEETGEELDASVINSPSALKELFARSGLIVDSVDREVLEELKEHPAIDALLKYRTANKYLSTYLYPYAEIGYFDEAGNYRVHPNYNQNITDSGRLSCDNPNLQNVTVNTILLPNGEEFSLRELFIPIKGYKLLGGDLSQVELKLLADLSQDPTLISIFEEDKDLHSISAGFILGKAPELVTPKERKQNKAVTFGIVYGKTAFGLCKDLGVSFGAAFAKISNWFKGYPGAKRFIESKHREARKHGWVRTVLGRLRWMDDINHHEKWIRQRAENAAQNTPIQGTSADGMKETMALLWSQLYADGTLDKVKLSIQVHDELLVMFKGSEQYARRLLKNSLQRGTQKFCTCVTITVGNDENGFDVSVVPTWKQLK